jgi:NAD(P)H dehydrogenase (quinone)
MRFLVLYAHPLADSYDAAIHRSVLESLRGAGHEVDDCDLYAENFNPVLPREQREAYEDTVRNQQGVEAHVARLRNCQGLVFVFPVWSHGMPAILKGYIDRVWVPGVAFNIVGGKSIPALQHIQHYAAVNTYGAAWWLHNLIFGNPNKRVLMRGLRSLVAPAARTLWLAQYSMDRINEAQRQSFLARVKRKFAAF